MAPKGPPSEEAIRESFRILSQRTRKTRFTAKEIYTALVAIPGYEHYKYGTVTSFLSYKKCRYQQHKDTRPMTFSRKAVDGDKKLVDDLIENITRSIRPKIEEFVRKTLETKLLSEMESELLESDFLLR